MKNIIIISLVVFYASHIKAQNYYYHFKNKVHIDIADNMLALFHEPNSKKMILNEILRNSKLSLFKNDSLCNNYTIIKFNKIDKDSILAFVKSIERINSIEPIIGTEKVFMVSSNKFYIQSYDDNQLKDCSVKFQFKIVRKNKFLNNWILCESIRNSRFNSIELCNLLFENGVATLTDPGWVYNFKPGCIVDPDFNNQWALNNTTNIGIDVNACNAWTITRGRPDVVVAVIDQGIELTHSEFVNNISTLSYNTMTGSSPSSLPGPHGTFCAGIIGANQNNKFISGIAPLATLMSISNSLSSVDPDISFTLADGFNFAVDNNADVISNSWSDANDNMSTLHLNSTFLENSILNAIQNGRNGLGCVVVFISGNDKIDNVNYPANFNDQLIVVGSIQTDGSRSNFSNYGVDLDVVAPGENILTTNTNNLIAKQSGTSMAGPMVSGIAALVLSVNRCLTQAQVKTIIELSCKKTKQVCFEGFVDHPNGAWNKEYGYGLVDAFESVKMAHSLLTTQFINIGGNDISTSDEFIYTILQGGCLPAGQYLVKRHRIQTTINYPYTQAPKIIGNTTGLGILTPSISSFDFYVDNISETQATVSTLAYEVITTMAGNQVGWLPCTPNDVKFNLSVVSSIEKDIYLQNRNENISYGYNGSNTITCGKNVTNATGIGDYNIIAPGDINMRAGKTVLLKEGFKVSAGSNFRAYIEPFFTCSQFPNGKIGKKINNYESNQVTPNLNNSNIDLNNNSTYFKIYPNPAISYFNLELNDNDISNIASIKIYDMIGKTIYKSNVFNSSIDVSSFSDGSYLVEILLNNNTKMTQKLLINKGGSN